MGFRSSLLGLNDPRAHEQKRIETTSKLNVSDQELGNLAMAASESIFLSHIQHGYGCSAFFNAHFQGLQKEPGDATEITMWSVREKKNYFTLYHVLPICKLQVKLQWIIL